MATKLPHLAQQLIADFVTELADRMELTEPIVEFGSLQVEPGQPNDLRRLFSGRTSAPICAPGRAWTAWTCALRVLQCYSEFDMAFCT